MVKRGEPVFVDVDFLKTLKKIKAQRELNDNPVNSLTELTKEMLLSPSFNNVIKELTKDNKSININIRMDKKNLADVQW